MTVRRRRDVSGFMKIGHDPGIDAMSVVAGAIAETHDIQFHGREQVPVRAFP